MNVSNNTSTLCIAIRSVLSATDLTLHPISIALFGIIYTIIVGLALLGNTAVVIVVCRNSQLRSVRNLFIVSLSVSDIVVSLVSGTVTPISAFNKTWPFGEYLCRLVPFIQGASLCFSTLTLTAIAIDRFILIVFPTKRPIEIAQAVRIIIINCCLASALSSPMLLKQALVEYHIPQGRICGKFCAEDWGHHQSGRSIYGTVVFCVQFVIPLMVISFCYIMISHRLGKGILLHNRTEVVVVETEQRRAAMQRRQRTNRMLIAMVVLFVLCWTPSVVFNFLRDYEWLPAVVDSQGYLFGLITHCISMMSTIWNPYLYALLNEQFRVAFHKLFAMERMERSTRSSMRLASATSLESTRYHNCIHKTNVTNDTDCGHILLRV